jgi:hypothetical protein
VPALTEPSGLAGAEPAELTGIRIGYARVSTGGQKLDRQTDALTAAGCRRIFADKQSGKDTDRAELRAALEFMQPGDTLVVPALDRLSRSLQDLITTMSRMSSGTSRSRPSATSPMSTTYCVSAASTWRISSRRRSLVWGTTSCRWVRPTGRMGALT